MQRTTTKYDEMLRCYVYGTGIQVVWTQADIVDTILLQCHFNYMQFLLRCHVRMYLCNQAVMSTLVDSCCC